MPPSMQRVIEQLGMFPGIGRKTAQRLGFHLLGVPKESVHDLAHALLDLKEKVGECRQCHNIAQGDLCQICRNNSRDPATVCVVEKVIDVLIFERMGEYDGHYHVLGGVISPLDGISPQDLNMDSLEKRLPAITELIIATPPSIEGDTTALYISELTAGMTVKVTRLARGLPMGANLEYADEATLSSAYSGRVDF